MQLSSAGKYSLSQLGHLFASLHRSRRWALSEALPPGCVQWLPTVSLSCSLERHIHGDASLSCSLGLKITSAPLATYTPKTPMWFVSLVPPGSNHRHLWAVYGPLSIPHTARMDGLHGWSSPLYSHWVRSGWLFIIITLIGNSLWKLLDLKHDNKTYSCLWIQWKLKEHQIYLIFSRKQNRKEHFPTCFKILTFLDTDLVKLVQENKTTDQFPI